MSLLDQLKARPQYLLPTHPLSRLIHAITRCRQPAVKDWLIRQFLRLYRVDMSEAVVSSPTDYESFNALFSRELKPDSRPVVNGERQLASPVDGTVSQMGAIAAGRIIQAKGHHYSVDALLGSAAWAAPFRNGHFATLYLAPYNYHRIHMPIDGSLQRMLYVPGRLFSVNRATAEVIPGLFARNERVACLFETPIGPVALVLVGALFVGSIETVWGGEITPPHRHWKRQWRYGAGQPHGEVRLERGAELGRFNMGSTVIVLLPPGAQQWGEALTLGAPIRMGELLATRG